MDNKHYSVLLNECIESLNIKPEGIYLDGTLGMGGHSEQIVKRLTSGHLLAIDRDSYAIEYAKKRLAPYANNITFIHGNFRDLPQLLKENGVDKVDGMLFDLGVSSPQLDEAERGFSYMIDAPLDMRMDRSEILTAWNIINEWPEDKIRKILYDYGEERYAPRIASAIVRIRQQRSINSTLDLVEIIRGAMPSAALREKQHPAKRSFQAFRIAVNDELSSISELMDNATEHLSPGGRLAVISFHSLEDRIIKNAINSREHGCICPRNFPVCTCGFVQTLRNITNKPILPSDIELTENPRSRSAKLRVAERV